MAMDGSFFALRSTHFELAQTICELSFAWAFNQIPEKNICKKCLEELWLMAIFADILGLVVADLPILRTWPDLAVNSGERRAYIHK